MALDLGGERRPVGLCTGPRNESVERRDPSHGIGSLAGGNESQATTHTEADNTHLGTARALLQQIDRARHVFACLGEVERHHQLARAIGFGGRLTVVQVGRNGHETCGGEAIDDVFDVVVQTPPLLDHDDARTSVAGDVAIACSTIALECHEFAHVPDCSANESPTFACAGPVRNVVRVQSTDCTTLSVSNTIVS